MVQLEPRRFEQILQLRQTSRTRNRCGNARTRDQPRERDTRGRGLAFRSHLVQSVQDSQPTFVQILLDCPTASALRQIIFGAVFARQKSGSQREVRNHAETFSTTKRFQLIFVNGTVVKVIQRLKTLVSCQPETAT